MPSNLVPDAGEGGGLFPCQRWVMSVMLALKKFIFSMADACCLVAIPLLVAGQEVQRLALLTGCTGCGLESPSPTCTMISAMTVASFPAMDAVWK